MKLPNLYKYKVKKRIGRGIVYTPYDAIDQTNGNEVLLRVLNKEIAQDPAYIVRFLSSARMLTLLDNPNIRTVYDFGNDQEYYFFSTETLVDWQPLDSLFCDTFSLSVEDFLEIFIRIGKTLRQAHLHGITHGFLNPKNIYINSEGQIKIDNFGFSWAAAAIFQRSNKSSIYTAQYASPELYESANEIDGRVDMYSMGAMMFHVLTGAPLYSAQSVADLQAQHRDGQFQVEKLTELELPKDFQNAIIKALDQRSDSRFLNLKEFVDYLETLKRVSANGTEPLEEDTDVQEIETTDNSPPYSEQYFVENEEGQDNGGGVFKLKGLLVTLLALFVVVSAYLAGKDKLDLAAFADSAFGDKTFEKMDTPTGTAVAGITQEVTDIDAEDLIAAMKAEIRNSGNQEDPDTEAGSLQRTAFGPSEMAADLVATKADDFKKNAPAEKDTPTKKTKSTKNTALAQKGLEKSHNAKPSPKKTSARVAKKSPSKSDAKRAVAKSDKSARRTSVNLVIKSDKDPKGTAVFVNNKFKGKTDHSGRLQIMDLEVGKRYTAKVSKNGYKTITKKFTATTNMAAIDLEMKPKRDIFGTLVLDAAPAADSVFVDGKLYRGKMPLNLTLPWGEHRIKYVNAKLKKSWEEVVQLKVGQILRVKHDFAKKEFGKVAVSLKNAANFGFGFVYVDGKLWHGNPNTTPLELKLSTGSHTLEVRREGFSSIPKDIIVVVEKDETKFVSFTFSKNEAQKTD